MGRAFAFDVVDDVYDDVIIWVYINPLLSEKIVPEAAQVVSKDKP
jgi:hypothetical protein